MYSLWFYFISYKYFLLNWCDSKWNVGKKNKLLTFPIYNSSFKHSTGNLNKSFVYSTFGILTHFTIIWEFQENLWQSSCNGLINKWAALVNKTLYSVSNTLSPPINTVVQMVNKMTNWLSVTITTSTQELWPTLSGIKVNCKNQFPIYKSCIAFAMKQSEVIG